MSGTMLTKKKTMKIFKALALSLSAILCVSCSTFEKSTEESKSPHPVYCNPLNLNYQVQPPNNGGKEASWVREGADPTMGLFKGKYYLFSSVSEGYWESENLVDWKSLRPSSILNFPILHNYAPTVVVIGDMFYFKDGNGPGPVYGTRTPEDPDSWKQVSPEGWHKSDCQFFLDDDSRLWIAYGCSPTGYLYIQEIDTDTLMPKGESHEFFMPDFKNRGWEGVISGKRGMDHLESHGWTEGGQLLKHNGIYYLVYSLPTLNNAYANGVYTSNNILGPYTYQQQNPITQKLTGFSSGSGHGEIVKDRYGNWWTFTCQSVWTFDRFERRIGMFPTTMDENGVLLSDTWLGDYPTVVPQKKRDSGASLWNGMNLLSVNRPVTVSSTHSGEPQLVVDEEVMTYWSAATGSADEWVQVDLGAPCLVEAVHANFCEVDLNVTREMALIRGVYNRFKKEEKTPTVDDFKTLLPASSFPIPKDPDAVIRYKVLGSLDGKKWVPIIDQSESTRDTPHDFNLAPKPIEARYVRLVNVHTPYGGKFAMRGLRVFGKGHGAKPEAPEFQVDRKTDRRKMEIHWEPVEGADGYVVRYGQDKERLYLANQFYNTNSALISCLENGTEYFVTVDAFNQNGYAKGSSIAKVLSNNYQAD
jgi:xylan 1,4-beta-xylosidase